MVRAIMRRFTSLPSRLLAAWIAAALVLAPIDGAVAASPEEQLTELYTRGQEQYDAGNFREAADLWAQGVQVVEESPAMSATRQTVLKLALDAYLRAYEADESDRSHLDAAKQLLDGYEASLEGSGTELSSETQAEKEKIEAILARLDAEAEAAAQAEAAAAAQAEADRATAEAEARRAEEASKRPGQGLIIGGGVMLGLAGVGVGMGIGGLVASLQRQNDWDAIPASERGSDEAQSIRQRGRTANAIGVTGAVLAPLFLGGGVALLVIGLRRNKRHAEKYADGRPLVVPAFGPDFAGLSLQGKF